LKAKDRDNIAVIDSIPIKDFTTGVAVTFAQQKDEPQHEIEERVQYTIKAPGVKKLQIKIDDQKVIEMPNLTW